ncbi:terminase small subunit-like protein [Spongiimicrobium salis]|uniref:terminase small subunit-like protein n=1 Tax=Spongiimicrobium salis TaxID=1667022 RepID=UPI00374CBF29
MDWNEENKAEAFQRICEHISEGNSLRSALGLHDTPSRRTFYSWLENDEKKVEQYARACEERAEFHFEEIFEIADDSSADKKILKDGTEVTDHEAIQRSRLRVDTRKWALSKMQPKKYGDKIDVTTDGEKINNDFTYNVVSNSKDG